MSPQIEKGWYEPMKRMLISLLLAVALLISAVPAFAETAAVDETPYTIHYVSSRNATDAFMLCLEEIVSMYQKTHPNFKMEIEYIPERASFLQKIKILGASNELPDWFDADPDNYIESLANEGYLTDMEELYKELGVNDRFFNISKDYARLNDGRLFLFTWQCNAEYFFYNKEHFAKAGIEKTPETFDEFLTACEKLQQAGFTPITVGDVTGGMFLRYMAFLPFRMQSNKYIEDAVKGVQKFADEPGIKAAEFMQSISKYFPEGFTTSDYDTFVNLFTSGECSMMYNGTWCLQSLVDENMNLKDQFGVFTMPKYTDADVTNQSDYFANSGIGTAILKDSMNDQMKSFMKFLFDNYADLLITKYNSIPSLMPSSTEGVPEIYLKVMDDANKVNTFAKCWDVVIDTSSLDTLNSETVNLALGVTTPQQWAAALDTAIAENNAG